MKKTAIFAFVAGLALLSSAPPAFGALPAECTASDDKTNPVISRVHASNAVVYATGVSKVTLTVAAADPDGAMTCQDANLSPVETTGSSGIDKVSVVVATQENDGPNYATADLDPVSADIWRTTLFVDRTVATGLWSVDVAVTDKGANKVETTGATSFLVRGNAILTANAAPEPVRKGQYFTVAGKARFLPTGYGSAGLRYTGVKDVPIRVYFSAKGAGTWTYMGSDLTDAKGVYSRRFKATRDGGWQARVPQNDYFVPKRSAVDLLDVR